MKCTVKILAAALAAIAARCAWAVPVVSGVDMSQPSKTVVIAYTLSGEAAVITLDVQTNSNTSAEADDPGWTSIGGAAVCNAQGDVWKKVETGSRRITWRPDLSWPDHVIADGGARAVVTAWSLGNTPDYMVVDIAGAAKPDSQSYYPAAEFVPGGVTNGIYKTSSLLMRKIMAKDVEWTMGSTGVETQRASWPEQEITHKVKLDGNYYIGVYEITQSQWKEVATNSTVSANFTTEASMRPMESVCYNEIRLRVNSNAAATSDEISRYSWPSNPAPGSFLGLLRLKTGIDFDLPSEAQWEFAARAGHGSGYWNDGSVVLNVSSDSNLNRLGRNVNNNPGSTSTTATLAPSEGGTAIVGSYEPSSWGLYDMHGNVFEWCLDWYQVNISTATDSQGELYAGHVNIKPDQPTVTLSGATASQRVIRGGSWNYGSALSRPAMRFADGAAHRYNITGFRVVCTAGLQ